MRVTVTFLSLAMAVLASVHGHTHGHSHLHLSSRQAAAPYTVTGVTGDVQPRLELRYMAADEPTMFYLFITAMQKFQAANDNITSYYAIAGIHGVPAQDWDGVQQCKDCGDAQGYCPHNSILFPAWHRVYVALLEQEFFKVVQQVSSQFPGNAEIADAAARMRFPYFDWAALPAPNTPVLPTLITDQQINISGPNGQETVANPLYRYDFTNPANLVFAPFTNWTHTLRHPSSNDIDAVSDIVDVATTLNQQQPSLQDQVYQLLSTCEDYSEFSNDDGSSTSPGCANSLESIHNLIHSYLGGPQSNVSAGHMTYLPLASYDPVFWLHHANVDRLFAIWQTLHSESYGGSQVAAHSTWTIAVNTTQDANSPLKPFYKDASGNFWTSNDVRDYESTFHYTYQGFTSTDRESNMAKLVNALYGPDAQYVAPSKPEVSSSSSLSTSSTTSTTSPSARISSDAVITSSSSTSSSQSSESLSSTSFSNPVSTSEILSFATPLSASKVSMTSDPALPTNPPSSGKDGFDLGDVIPSGMADLVPSQILSIHVPGVKEILAGIGLPGFDLPELSVPKFAPSLTTDKGAVIQYVANVRFPRWALGGSYIIYLFNGDPASDSPISFMTADKLIGIVSALAGGKMHKSKSISSSSVPLTRTLQKMVKAGQLPDMKNSTVLPYLKANLTWRVVGPDGTIVDSAKLHGFQVSCYSSSSQQNSTTALPKWSPFQPEASVTDEKPGGATKDNIIQGLFRGIGDLFDGDRGNEKDHSTGNKSSEDGDDDEDHAVGSASSNSLGGDGQGQKDHVIGAAAVSSCTDGMVTEYVTVTRTRGVVSSPTGYNAK